MTKKRILGTGNFALDIIYQREYPERFDTTKKRNPFVDKKLIEEVGNTCGNVMCMLPYLGVETYPIGHFDESEQGMKIAADLKRYGANTRFVKNSKDGGTTLMTCIHKLDANGQHTMSHRATAPNSRFPKRKQLRKDEVQGFVDALDFKPDAYFFDVSDAGPRELAKALKSAMSSSSQAPTSLTPHLWPTIPINSSSEPWERKAWNSTCEAKAGRRLPLFLTKM